MTTQAQISPQTDAYYSLIDQLLQCPSGSEPELLNQHRDLLDLQFVQTLLQVAAMLAHQDQQEASQFLVFIARELAQQLKASAQAVTNAE
ncbi:MAG: hypothetical protein F6K42_06600 [Leptolyngbya sp. SIO1D8]|nr:hypothetical protein [Leptolyngbya sp. SIO1D8]